MSVYGSTNSPAFKSNVKLCRAVEKQAILYDSNHEYHRKRVPSENCWDMVAAETGVSVEKCKRRWRQIRNDFVRWMNTDDHRKRNGLKRSTFYLAEELDFLKQHLSLSEASVSDRDKESSERERASKSKSKEPAALDESYKVTERDNAETVDDEPLSKLKQTENTQSKSEESKEEMSMDEESSKDAEKSLKTEKSKEKINAQNKVKENLETTENSLTEENKDKDTSSKSQDKLSEEQVIAAPSHTGVKKPEFFIKQSNKASPNCLIIGKKPAEIVPVLASNSFVPMVDDCADETESLGGGRRLRRGPGRIKQLAIQKSATEQRLTRLQRRKSMTVAAANSLRSSTSPVKMTPLPRVVMAAKPATAKGPSKTSPKSTPAKSPRDDIFPRPRAAAPTAQQLVLARRPSPAKTVPPVAGQAQPPQTTQIFPVRHYNGVGRPPGPARVAVTHASRPFVVPLTPAPRVSAPVTLEPKKIPPVSGASASPSPPLTRVVSSSNTLVISTTSSFVSSQNTSTVSTTSANLGVITTSITASPIVSTTPSAMSTAKVSERSTQTETSDVFSDDHFLEMVRFQMKEMNPRQKMHFKQKIFQSLMETFDDATDFPKSGEVQHFNINTPSGYEHVSDPELRLVRELVSMISAAKHTPMVGGNGATSVPGKPVTALRTPVNKIAHRIYRQSPGTPVAAGSPVDEEKKLYRILPSSNNKLLPGGYAYPSQLVAARNDSIDSNTSSRTVPGRVTFVVPGGAHKGSNIVDPLTNIFASGSVAGGASKAASGVIVAGSSAKQPVLVRQMGRRYSVCGSGGPSATITSPAAIVAAGSVTPTVNSGGLESMLKRRLANPSQSMVPPQQRPRYSNSPQTMATGVVTAIAPGNSLLVRRAVAGAQKQVSPTGGGSVPQRTPQIASIQGSFNSFATPSPGGSSASTTPIKRGMVIANVKDNSQLKSAVSSVRPGLQKSNLQGKSGSLPNVANLLGESRAPTPAQVRAKTPSTPTAAGGLAAEKEREKEQEREKSETAGIIAADYFDISRLKREPQDIADDDILGM